MSDIFFADCNDLIEFANEWAGLGDAIQRQVMYVCAHDFDNCDPEDFDHDEVNPNAIKIAAERLQGQNEEMDEAFSSYFDLIRKQATERHERTLARIDRENSSESKIKDAIEEGALLLRLVCHDEEWCVQYWLHGKLDPIKSYYTSDLDDAVNTRDAMAKEAMEKTGLIAFCPKHRKEDAR